MKVIAIEILPNPKEWSLKGPAEVHPHAKDRFLKGPLQREDGALNCGLRILIVADVERRSILASIVLW
jgi:hypothetical protein